MKEKIIMHKRVLIFVAIIIVLYSINLIATYNTYHFSGKLINAIRFGDDKQVEEVLNKYPNGNVNVPEYRTEIIPALCEFVNQYPIQIACTKGNPEIVRMLAERGAKLDVVAVDGEELPLAFYAAGMGWESPTQFDKNHVEITRYLIEKGMDAHAKDTYGNSVHDELLSRAEYNGWSKKEEKALDELLELTE